MTHDLHEFIQQLGTKMEAEYKRIRKVAAKDPGTAGDEGEENWAQLLRDWLPPSYRVVTKGQILDEEGTLSPQVDVLVLKPSYPPSLHHKKKYFAAGVAAAFECKLTLKREHIFKAMETAAFIKRMSRKTEGTPFGELVAMPIFGLLAHSHSWGPTKPIAENVELIGQHVDAADLQHVQHPREMIDLLCISNLATWVAEKQPLFDPEEEIHLAARALLDPKGVPATYYMCHAGMRGFIREQNENFNPLGVLIGELLVKLAWEDASLRDIASYFVGVEFSSTASGKARYWPRSIYSTALRRKLTLKRLVQVIDWNEWAVTIQ